jgi:hypothetical protein
LTSAARSGVEKFYIPGHQNPQVIEIASRHG